MKLRYFLIIISIAILLVPATNAYAPIDIQQKVIKTVYDFQIQQNINSMKNDLTTDLYSELSDRLMVFGNNFNNFSFTLEASETAVTDWGINPDSGKNWYHFYPKISISGSNSTMTQGEFNQEFNIVVSLIRIEVISFLQSHGATDVDTHIHYTYGSFDLDEGF